MTRSVSVLFVTGVVFTGAYALTHPVGTDPMDHASVFREYADSGLWVFSHLVQFAGFACVFTGLMLLSNVLRERRGGAGELARAGFAFAAAALAVSAVLQAVDGIALKAMVDAWSGAPENDKKAFFAAALSVRWIEIGVNSFFRLLQGATFIIFGAALAADPRFSSWLGWTGAVAGAGITARGCAVAYSGFSLDNPVYVWSEVFRFLLYVWLLVTAWTLYRHPQDSAAIRRARGRSDARG